MPIYEYTALTESGQTKTGILDADTPRAARDKLRKDKIHVTAIRVANELAGGEMAAPAGKGLKREIQLPAFLQPKARISASDLANFTRQFSTLLHAGTPLAECLQVLIEQAGGRRFEAILRDVRERVTGGDTLADALGNHRSVFNELYVNMVRAGEASGQLDVVLQRIGVFLQRQARLRNKVAAALTYPIIMVTVGFLVVIVLMKFVVPKILALVTARAQTLPWPTQVLKAVSGFFADYWLLLLLGLVGLYVGFVSLRSTEKGRRILDRFKLQMPIMGDLFRKQAISRFAVTLSTLLKSGLPVLDGLKIVKNVVDNTVLAEIVGVIHDRIVEGTDIASPLKKSKMFPAVVGHMIAIGEQSGQLDEILSQLADSYDEEVDVATQRMTAVLEPILIVSIAVLVAFIVLAVILPMLQVGKSIGR
ncbi:MAG: type II secretion system F family protein [Planctomycetes bacterium]|nr:type II secretion system F family protein [Planctomycetota bacterium]